MGRAHQPHNVCSCEVALRAVAAAEGRPGGGASCLDVGRPKLGALPRPTAHPGGMRPGHATQWLWVRRVWAWGPVTNPTARCGSGTRAPGGGGGGLSPGSGLSRGRCSPTPDRPSLGRAAGACYPPAVGAGGVGMGILHRPNSARSCVLALRDVGAARGRTGGGCLWPACGVSELGALRRLNAHPWGMRPGPATQWLWVRKVRA